MSDAIKDNVYEEVFSYKKNIPVVSYGVIIKNSISSKGVVSGVYVLLKSNTIVYIGTASDIFNRISTHKKRRFIEFDSYTLFQISEDYNDGGMGVKNYRKHMEAAMIKRYSPRYNLNHNTDYIEGHNKYWYAYVSIGKNVYDLSKEIGVSKLSIKKCLFNIEIKNKLIDNKIKDYLLNNCKHTSARLKKLKTLTTDKNGEINGIIDLKSF